MKHILVVTVLAFFATPVFADNTAAPATGGKVHPCVQIKQACEAAGFVKGGAKTGKGLAKNCVKPILSGGSVQGVSVDASTVQACKDKRTERQARKAAAGK